MHQPVDSGGGEDDASVAFDSSAAVLVMLNGSEVLGSGVAAQNPYELRHCATTIIGRCSRSFRTKAQTITSRCNVSSELF